MEKETLITTSAQTAPTLIYGVTTKREKIAYSLGDVGCNFIWSFASAFLTLYYTDSVGLSAAFLGTMMLIARILDGASDIAMGAVIEKTRTRWGKARPWILIACVPFALSLVLIMNVPGSLSEQGKNAYAFLSYIFMAVICYTIVNLAYHAMLPRISLNQQDRSVISGLRTFLTLMLVLLLNIVTPLLLESFGGQKSQRAWTIVSSAYALIALGLLLITFFGTKEKVELRSEVKAEKIPLIVSLKAVATNKYFYLVLALFVVNYISAGLTGVGLYYARDVLGDVNFFGLISLAGVSPMLIGIPLIPFLFKKFGKRNSIRFGFALCILGGLLTLTNPTNAGVYLASSVIKGFGGIPFIVAMFTLSADITDYGEWKSGIRAEGFAYSCTTFGIKLGTGVGSAMLGWILAWGRYDADAAVQSEPAINAMILLAVVIPLVISAIQLILIQFWDLDKHLPDIQKDLQERKLQKG